MIKAKHWGWNYVDGVYFFLEEGRPLPPMSPFDKFPSVECPHKTKGTPIERIEPMLYFSEGTYEFPESVEVRHSKVRYAGYSCVPVIKQLMRETNYIPLVLEGVRLDEELIRVLDILYNEVAMTGRSIVMCGDDSIPFPSFVKRINKRSENVKKMDGVKSR